MKIINIDYVIVSDKKGFQIPSTIFCFTYEFFVPSCERTTFHKEKIN